MKTVSNSQWETIFVDEEFNTYPFNAESLRMLCVKHHNGTFSLRRQWSQVSAVIVKPDGRPDSKIFIKIGKQDPLVIVRRARVMAQALNDYEARCPGIDD